MNKINVAIADQHLIIRTGLSDLLNQNQSIKVILLAENPSKLIKLLRHSIKKPDVVIIDINLAKANEYLASKKILNILPKCKIMYLSDTENKEFMEKLISKNAHGFISREYDEVLIHDSVRKVFE